MGELYDVIEEGDYRVTEWQRPSFIIETTAGLAYYQDWCEMEIPRLNEGTNYEHYIDDRRVDRHVEICIKRRDK